MVSRIAFGVVYLSIALATTHSYAEQPAAGRCGRERWSIKTGTDPDAARVALSSVTPTTVAEMGAWPAPNSIPQNARVEPHEVTVYTVSGTLVETYSSTDSDYHLLLQDASGRTVITEVPDPACVGAASPFLEKIRSARNEVDAKINMGPTGTTHTVSIPVQITGVAMFDELHGQPGAAPNGIEIHPVLDIQFTAGGGAGGIPEFHQATAQIYRGGRPGAAGLGRVKSLGARMIIDLEDDMQAMQQERQYAARLGLGWVSVPMSASVSPGDREVSQILSLLQDPRALPVFIHCKHGQDRTGLIIGLYRVFVQRWTPAQAYREMLQNGFHPDAKLLDQYFRDKTGYRGGVFKDPDVLGDTDLWDWIRLDIRFPE